MLSDVSHICMLREPDRISSPPCKDPAAVAACCLATNGIHKQ